MASLPTLTEDQTMKQAPFDVVSYYSELLAKSDVSLSLFSILDSPSLQ